MAKRITILFFLILFSCANLFAQRPKVALVLSGGGALGFSHIGVLKVLEENGIHIDYITGTSMGGIVGALSAYGYSADEIEKEVSKIDWGELFNDSTNRDFMSYSDKTAAAKYFLNLGFDRHGIKLKQGLISGQKVENLFNKLVGPCSDNDDFDNLPTPFRAVSADILTGEQYVLKSGSLAQAMRCTMSIPGIFTPVEKDGHFLVDGMVVNNLPVDVAREMGADVVIAVNLTNIQVTKEELRTPVGTANQMLNLYIYDIIQDQIKNADIVLDPPLSGYSSMSYFKMDEIVKAGEDVARWNLDKIKELVGEENINKFPRPERVAKDELFIDRIEIDYSDPYERNIMMRRFSDIKDDPFDIEEMNRIASDFHSSGKYESIRYYVDREDDKNVLKINVDPVKSGPHYLRFGFFTEMDTNVHERYLFNLLLGVEFKDLLFDGDRLNTELEIFRGISADTAYFIPFCDYFFLEPEVAVRYLPEVRERLDFEHYGESYLFRTESSLEVGTFISSLGKISVGVMDEYFGYDYSSRFPHDDLRGFVNSLFFHSRMDKINSIVLPEHGTFLEFMVKYSNEVFGSEDTYVKAKFTFWQYFQFLQRNSLGIKLFAGMDFATDVPYYDRSFLSYVNAFPGYSNNEFSSRNTVGGVADYKFNLFFLNLGGKKEKFFLTFRGGVAAIYEDFDLFTGGDRDLIYGGGVGVGLNLSHCPIVLEASMNDNRRIMVHLSAGNKF